MIARWRQRLREARSPSGAGFREERWFLALAIIIGLFSGLSVVCFRIAIDEVRLLALGSGLHPRGWRVVIAPVIAGLVIAVLVRLFFRGVRGSGVNQTKSALFIYDGYIPFNTVVGKFITCALSIGAGFSLGPEDPSLQIGAGLASAIGRRLRLSREKLRLIAPVGAAAGLAAAFNSPIAAVLFVIEEVIGRWSAGILGAVVLSAISSVVVVRWFLGDAPLFRIPSYRLEDPLELIGYAALGVVGGLISLVFIKIIGAMRPRLKAQPAWTQLFQPAVAGMLIGLTGLRFPQVMGAGYEFMDQAMNGQFAWKLLILLALLKIFATGISFASGTPGGLFAPTLFIGAMVGAAVGNIEHILVPGLTIPVGAYALVGMGVLFAGILRAPLTSVFMILEVSGNYSIILPVILSNTIAYFISRAGQHTPIFDLLSQQDGIHLPSMEEEREVPILRVEDAMRPPPTLVLGDDLPVAAALQAAEGSGAEFFLIGGGAGWRGLGIARLRAIHGRTPELPLGRVLPARPLPYLHPDHPLDAALRTLHDWPLLPVVHRADLTQLMGVLSVRDVIETYKRLGSGTILDTQTVPESASPTVV